MHPACKRAIKARAAIARSGVKEQDTVSYCGKDYAFIGISTGGLMKIKPLSGGKTIIVNPLGVIYNGKPVQEFRTILK